ncbi:MAG: glutathione S-transferase N-terminal domain-containing protein [Acidocella sp.]|nr:glutathione S-transferase N-terminal domain-containing protein [Acidocella sp.]
MSRKLYELAAADETLLFSPYCWRTKLALAHKNLEYETIPWRFTEKDAIAFSGQGKVPVLVDGARTIHDSEIIAEYLEATYPNEPALFADPAARAITRFVKSWTEDVLHPLVARIVLPDIFVKLDPRDKAYFRDSRERAWGMTIEDINAQRPAATKALTAGLAPLRGTLKAQPFIAGTAPAYADHIIFGALQWAVLTSATPLLGEEPIIAAWMSAVLECYGL